MGRLSCLRAAGSPGYPGGTGTHLHSHGGRRRAGGSTPRGPRRAARHLGTVPAHSSPAIPFLSQVSRDPVLHCRSRSVLGPGDLPCPAGLGWAAALLGAGAGRGAAIVDRTVASLRLCAAAPGASGSEGAGGRGRRQRREGEVGSRAGAASGSSPLRRQRSLLPRLSRLHPSGKMPPPRAVKKGPESLPNRGCRPSSEVVSAALAGGWKRDPAKP